MKTAAKTAAVKNRQEVLAPNAFIGKKQQPTTAELVAALGPAKALWDRVVEALMLECPELRPEWKCSSAKLGWGMRLQLKGRNIVYLSPCNGSFRVGFVFGEKTLKAVREAYHDVTRQETAEWGARILDLIASAPKYAEGTGVRFEVREGDVEGICTLARVKISN